MDDYDRRTFIKTSLPGFLGLALSLPAISAFANKANAFEGRQFTKGKMNWDAYLTKVNEVVQQQHLDNWTEEHYLKQVIQLARQLNLQDPVLQEGFKTGLKGAKNGRVDFTDLEKNKTFAVCLLDFQEGERINPHDHPGMTGVIQCASGSIQVDNYDFFQKRQGRDTVLLKHTANESMKPGNVSSLTSKARNIHQLVANKPTQLVDVFSPPYDPQRATKSSWYKLDSELFEGHKGLYEAQVRS